MVFVAGVNGLLGSQGVATLCIHGFEFLHLTTGNHDESHNDCEVHSCEDSENERSEAVVVGSEPCADHCTDIEIKGVDYETPVRIGFDMPSNPPVAEVDFNCYFSDTFAVSTTVRTLPPPRGPPRVNSITELCIKKTVLRL